MASDIEKTLGKQLDKHETAAVVETVAKLSADQLKAIDPALRQRLGAAFEKAEKSTANSPYEEGQARHEQYVEELQRLHAIDEVAKAAAKNVLSDKGVAGGQHVTAAPVPAVGGKQQQPDKRI